MTPNALPPLNALKAFEAAARFGSFALAAHELSVTPAAVSQLVRKLERYLGKTLFNRFNNRIALTDAGQTVFAGITPALHDIAATIERVSRAKSQRKLVISSELSVAECWLVPALPRFLAKHPHLNIDLRADDEAVSHSLQGVDLRISYGRLTSQDNIQIELVHDAVIPMCSPDYLKRKGGKIRFAPDVAPELIHTIWGQAYGSNPTWHDWVSASEPRPTIDMAAGHIVNASRFALQLARGGVGFALGQRWLAQDDVAAGRLVVLSDQALPLGQSYVLALPQSRARRPDVLAFRDWILEETADIRQGLQPHP